MQRNGSPEKGRARAKTLYGPREIELRYHLRLHDGAVPTRKKDVGERGYARVPAHHHHRASQPCTRALFTCASKLELRHP